jgi:hypothetical protein
LIPLQPLGGNAWRVGALAGAASCCISFPRVSRLPYTLLVAAETASEGVLHVLKTFLEPMAKAIPAQRSCKTSSGVDTQSKLLHKANGGGVCRTASNHCSKAQGQLRRHEENFHSYKLHVLHRLTTTTQGYAKRGEPLTPGVPVAMQLHDIVYVFHSRP